MPRPRTGLDSRWPASTWFRALLLLVLSGAVVGCGAATAPRRSVGRPVSRVPVACRGALSVLPRALWWANTGNNGAPECHLSAGGVRAVVNVDSSPQPYMRLEREIVEDGQSFGTVRSFAPPRTVNHLGLDAAWLPSLSQLITANPRVLVTVTVGGRAGGHARSSAASRRTLAVRLARAYLG